MRVPYLMTADDLELYRDKYEVSLSAPSRWRPEPALPPRNVQRHPLDDIFSIAMQILNRLGGLLRT